MLYGDYHQRWSPRGRLCPRGHILKSLALALASKVKSLALASRPQVLENWPVLGSRTALFFELLKFCGALEKFFGKRLFVEIAFFFLSPEKFLGRPFFFESACACVLGPWPWPRAFLSLASDFFCVLGLDGLEPCVLDSTSESLIIININHGLAL